MTIPLGNSRGLPWKLVLWCSGGRWYGESPCDRDTNFRLLKAGLRTAASQPSPVGSSRNSEVEEVFLERFDGGAEDFAAVEDVAHFFAQPKQFPEACPSSPFRILDCEVKQLEHSLKSAFEARVVSTFECSRCALEFASDVAELLVDREGEPAAVAKTFVD